MRKLLIGLLAVGLVFAFTMPLYAADMSWSGWYRTRAFYFDRDSVLKTDTTTTSQYYDQILRVSPKIQIAEGIAVEMRADIMEYTWGTNNAAGAAGVYGTEGSTKNKDSFNVERAWGSFVTGIGKFSMGTFGDGSWGTGFCDLGTSAQKIQYESQFGPVGVLAIVQKAVEGDKATNEADDDYDVYKLGLGYSWDGGEAGVLGVYAKDDTNAAYKEESQLLVPYVKANFGPLYVEAEIDKYFGTDKDYYAAGTADVDKSGLSYYAMAKVNLGPAYVGAMYAYVQGDDPATTTDDESGKTGADWNPSNYLWNDGGSGRIGGADFGAYTDATNSNLQVGGKVYSIFAGFSPIEKLSLYTALVTSYADRQGSALHDDFGLEWDFNASYKLFDSVSYNLYFGYLWAGDYWKGTSTATQLEDTYMIRHEIKWVF